MTSRRKFTGALAEPISDAGSDFGAVFKQQMAKVPLLFDHYGIAHSDERSSYRLLAHALACEIVPGFKVKKRRGKPRTRSAELVSLFIAVNELRQKHPEWRVRTAIAHLCRRPSSAWHGLNAETLENTYHAAENDPRVAWIFEEKV